MTVPADPNAKLEAELDKDIERVSQLLVLTRADIEEIQFALDLLKTSSNADFGETLVAQVIRKMEKAILKLEERSQGYQHQILRILWRIKHRLEAPQLYTIKIVFNTISTIKGVSPMAAIGPVILTTAGQVVTASIAGFDQLGNPWTGTIPPVTYAIDNAAIASSVPNADGVTDAVTAVANGVANLTASLTSAEGLALTDTETVTVAIAVVPPPTPVLSSIKLQFA